MQPSLLVVGGNKDAWLVQSQAWQQFAQLLHQQRTGVQMNAWIEIDRHHLAGRDGEKRRNRLKLPLARKYHRQPGVVYLQAADQFGR